ncbi:MULTISPECIES: Rieske 2Fe-2S domain-containing protein [unclassified Acinetobacter]|uniref:Rieske 2Fe-2S domain-containing protein n=1 Tax=unclassified Acinetobacter TaxID=196816 RepID=UPI00190CD4E3|nr:MULTISPECIES: Rieske 2Fe-2S domain-containing protein [unclassified Acinetobacter]MBK0065193.1 Rieske 2Fe-2S domain-containing protein [Acinetobacter sp. S55]MBK0068434.1 Rieske 2Fe-2S domain-containing protein [Acinetobacter sp. S54]
MITGQWTPLVPSILIETGEVEQVLVRDKDVAVWRSMQGHVQIWENRCPHRSVRLSLGQVRGESLVCAYHGWQFAAEDGHCQRIPAQPEQRAPKSLCARSYAVMENSGLIWYGEDTPPDIDPLFEEIQSVYAGSVTISVTLSQVQDYLLEVGLTECAMRNGLSWRDDAADRTLRIYLTPTQTNVVTVHAMLSQSAKPTQCHPLLRQMRENLESEKLSHA